MLSASLRSIRSVAILAALATVLATLAIATVAAPPADAAQPVPVDGVVGFDWSPDGRRLLLGDGTAVSVGDPPVGP